MGNGPSITTIRLLLIAVGCFLYIRNIELLQKYESNVLGSGAFVFGRRYPKG